MAQFLSQAWPYAAAVLVILGIIVLVLLIRILVSANKTMKSVEVIAGEAEKEVPPALKKVNPIVDKAELTIDTVNLEMLRVDSILEDVEQVSTVAGKTATAVDTVTSGPADAVSSLVDRIRGSLGSKRKEQIKQGRVVYPIAAARQTDDAQQTPEKASEDDQAMKEAAQLAAKITANPEGAAENQVAAGQDQEQLGKHSVMHDDVQDAESEASDAAPAAKAAQ
jgi:uncharacterized protein YoxC